METFGRAEGGETFGRADGGFGDPRRAGNGAEAGRQECRPHGLVASEAIEFAEGEWKVATIRDCSSARGIELAGWPRA